MFGFDAPKVIGSEVFAVLPEAYRQPARSQRNPLRLNAGGTTLEGPSFDRAGNLYFTDIRNSRIFRASPKAEVALVAEYDGEPNGIKIHRDGRIFVADHRHGIMLLDPERGTVETLIRGPGKERFKGVNDLFFAEDGALYFTDQGATGLHDPTGRVYRLGADGGLSCVIDTVPSPNGLVLDATGTILYLAVTRASAIWYVPLTAEGRPTRAGVFSWLPAGGPDGLAFDTQGNLAAADPRLGVVWVFDRRGLPVYRVEPCVGSYLTNIAFGGPDNRWLYMTEGDTFSILRAEMPFPGRRMYSHHER